MSSNDLLSYSIMQGGNKVGPISPVRLPVPSALPSSTKIVLPPIDSLKRLTEHNLNTLNTSYGGYTYSKGEVSPRSTRDSLSPPNSVKLQSPAAETRNVAGAADVSAGAAAIAALVAAAANASATVMPSPTTTVKVTTPTLSKSSVTSIPITPAASPIPIEESHKRRQRLGPSCDSCRTRKVKCNAEISILAPHYAAYDLTEFNLSPAQIESLHSDHSVVLPASDPSDAPWMLTVSHTKLIKFRACKSCACKDLECKFSKGFTKEDILVNKKSLKTRSDKQKVGKPVIDSSRKSSCFNCRKRKIKCSMNDHSEKCESCSKRNSSCSFI
ncbi:general substrate transporter [Yamadazyma tenuis]|uniref:Zn(2)-C6 fungal-type domain-containing protein n=1 Tax=Candida tenuis (strain ATCC 10573 / BCRC 21748 / CBS 615 / JCM 9827 / NBRC 10315 / NRRL Y-1498 / VKM Y-70) TaxID=590646 RepID=G3B6G4_CANTC|nr:uncharacterized protein CANTEDRAFT_123771 [Yamadazyma tenuis ATCC 10573]EGV63688.1 hypothetical protein CANTEDRAFT_123771 [Yamadazyma tenuis ATCC 10573]WEJ96711.1 general substrate transporter [Yamadazyma tenuis]